MTYKKHSIFFFLTICTMAIIAGVFFVILRMQEVKADQNFDNEKKQVTIVDGGFSFEFFSNEKFEAVLEEAVKRYFKVPSEVPEKMSHYKGLHRFWIHCEKNRLGIK